MPYCPKCDIEFVEGVTVCSDCKGPLVPSEKEYKALKEKEAKEKKKAEYEEHIRAMEERDAETDADILKEMQEQLKEEMTPVHVYVNKAQKYEDLKSSASAFYLVGSIVLIFAVLNLAGIIRLPMTGFSRILFLTVMIALGIAAFVIAIYSSASAKKIAPQIRSEKRKTAELITWFLDTYDTDTIDSKLAESEDYESLPEEERTLKRFEIIQDLLITNHDLPDQSYVDSLCETIYSRLYER